MNSIQCIILCTFVMWLISVYDKSVQSILWVLQNLLKYRIICKWISTCRDIQSKTRDIQNLNIIFRCVLEHAVGELMFLSFSCSISHNNQMTITWVPLMRIQRVLGYRYHLFFYFSFLFWEWFGRMGENLTKHTYTRNWKCSLFFSAHS